MSRNRVRRPRYVRPKPRSASVPVEASRVSEEDAKVWFDLMCVPITVEGWREDAPICWRHWGPAAALGHNGGGMMVVIGREWIRNLAPKGSYSKAARERQWKEAGHICCRLGDVRMFELWQQLAPGSSPFPLVEATV